MALEYRDLQEMAGDLAGWFSPVKGSLLPLLRVLGRGGRAED